MSNEWAKEWDKDLQGPNTINWIYAFITAVGLVASGLLTAAYFIGEYL